MSGVRLADRLITLGLDPADGPAATALFDAALAGFLSVARDPPAHAWWVPGRLEVFGKHTDYAGGRTLVAAVPRGFAVLASPRAGAQVHVVDARTAEDVTLTDGAPRLGGWRHYVEVVVSRLARNFAGAFRGCEIAFASNLPRASGMSSSSALVVGVASALARLWHLEDRPEWRRNIPDVAALAMYFACLENGSAFGDLDGDAGVGTHGGSEDHAAMLLGTPGVVTAFSFVPMRRLDDARVPDDWRFVVAPSGVTAEKTGTAREAYNRLSEGADVLLRLWNARHEPARSLAAALGAQPEALDELRQSIRAGHVEGWARDELERRLEHFRREDARVPEALRAFQQSEAARLGELSEASQQEAGELLGNQIPETRALAERARALGAFAACSFGAGFGGSVWALVERNRAVELCDRWGAPGNRSIVPRPFVVRPGPPVVELIGG